MKLVIAGSRTLFSKYLVHSAFENLHVKVENISEVVSGHANGIDRAGEKWAAWFGVPVVLFPADWDTHGKSAGYIRNRQMAEYGDRLLAIWDGHSKGTLNMITEMQKLEKPVHIMEVYFK